MKKRKYVLLISYILLSTIFFCGCGGEDDLIKNDPKVIDPWVYLKDTSLSNDKILLDFASSAGELGIRIGIMGIVFSILYMAIRIIFTQNAAKKEEIKQEAMIKGVIGILIFSIPFWLGVMKTLGDAFI